jgi:hypothetical protein
VFPGCFSRGLQRSVQPHTDDQTHGDAGAHENGTDHDADGRVFLGKLGNIERLLDKPVAAPVLLFAFSQCLFGPLALVFRMLQPADSFFQLPACRFC